MNFPSISEKKFAGLSLAGSIVIIITTSIWFDQVGPKDFDNTLIAGMLMLGSANLVYALFYRRLRPATLAGSLWATAIVWVWYMMEVLDELAYIRHGSGDLWFVLPLFYGISLIASIIATAARTKLLSKILASSILGVYELVFYRQCRFALDFLPNRTFDYFGYRSVD